MAVQSPLCNHFCVAQATQTYVTAAGCDRAESLTMVRILFPNSPNSVLLVTLTAAVGAGSPLGLLI